MSKLYYQQYKSDQSIPEASQFSFQQEQFMSSETESQQLFRHFTEHLSSREAPIAHPLYQTNNLEKTVTPECRSQKSLCTYDLFHHYKEQDIHQISTLFKRDQNKDKMTLKQLKIENEIKKKKQQEIGLNKQQELIDDDEQEFEFEQEQEKISTRRRKNLSQQNKLRYNSTSPRVKQFSYQSKQAKSVKQNYNKKNNKNQVQYQIENQNLSTSQEFSSQSNSEQDNSNKIIKYQDCIEQNNESSFNDQNCSSQQMQTQKIQNISFQQNTENQLMFGEEFPYNQSVIEQLDEESENGVKPKYSQNKFNKNYKPIHKRIQKSLQEKEEKIEKIRQEIMQEKLLKQFLEVECNLTFHPKINPTDKLSRSIDEFYGDISDWQQKKLNGIYQNQLQKQLEEQSDTTFTPELNLISRTIVGEKHKDFDKIEDRLLFEGLNYQLSKQKFADAEQKSQCTFKPYIGQRSLKIAAKQKSIDLFSSQKSSTFENKLQSSLSSIEQNTNLQCNLDFNNKNSEILGKYYSLSQTQLSQQNCEENKSQNQKKITKKEKENINLSKQQQQRNFLKQKKKAFQEMHY